MQKNLTTNQNSSLALKLDEKLRFQVQSERKITHEILLTLQTIEITQSYRELGYGSLYEYLIKGHGYSEGAANRRIQSARLLKACPEILPQIQAGKLNLTQLSLLQTAIRQEERKTLTKVSKEQKQDAFKRMENQNTFETQKVLVEVFKNFEIPKKKILPTNKKTIQVQLEFEEKDWEKIEELLNYMSHKMPDQKLETALLYWADQIQKKKQSQAAQKHSTGKSKNICDHKNTEKAYETKSLKTTETLASPPPPLRRQKDEPSEKPKEEQSKGLADIQQLKDQKQKREYIPVQVRNKVFQKARYQCEYQSPLTGLRCSSLKYLDLDHRIPLALGGSNAAENLRVLCRAHNHLSAKQMGVLNINF